MDYKVLIALLRDNGMVKTKDDIECAADAIETLLAERDAAVEELRGICWCCANGRPMRTNAGIYSKITACDHLEDRGIRGCAGREKGCPYWQWRGPQKEQTNNEIRK